MTMRRCEDCEWWVGLGASHNGVCCRYPESVTKQVSQWCGEFERRSKRDALGAVVRLDDYRTGSGPELDTSWREISFRPDPDPARMTLGDKDALIANLKAKIKDTNMIELQRELDQARDDLARYRRLIERTGEDPEDIVSLHERMVRADHEIAWKPRGENASTAIVSG